MTETKKRAKKRGSIILEVAVLFLIGIWGDGTLDSDVAEEKLGGVSLY